MVSEMRSTAATLHAWGASFQQITDRSIGLGRFSKYKYTSDKLLKAVRLALRLRGGALALEEVVARSLALALPLHLQGSFLQSYSDEARLRDSLLPSRTLVQRSEIALDIAILLLSRSMFSSQSYRFALSDASPLGGCGLSASQTSCHQRCDHALIRARWSGGMVAGRCGVEGGAR